MDCPECAKRKEELDLAYEAVGVAYRALAAAFRIHIHERSVEHVATLEDQRRAKLRLEMKETK